MPIDPPAGDWPYDDAEDADVGELPDDGSGEDAPDEPLFADGENWEDGWE